MAQANIANIGNPAVEEVEEGDKCRQYLKDPVRLPKNLNFTLRPRQDLCIHRFDEYSTTNGVLLLHNVGSGKTITSLTLAINGLDWDNGAPEDRVILLVHPTGLMDEFMTEIEQKILNIRRLPYGPGNGLANNECITDRITGIRRYKYEKFTQVIPNGRNEYQDLPQPPRFYIESIQFNELARYFARYDESINRIRTIFRGKIVIIDEAHRLFRQFDVCDKSSMLITKYVNDNLLGGAKKIIAMTGTPLKNGISDMLTLLKLINIANITNRDPLAPIFTLPAYQQFDITNKTTFRNLIKTTKKTIDPRFFSSTYVAIARTWMAFVDFISANRTDLSESYPSFTDKYLSDCAKINNDGVKKGAIVGWFQYIKLLGADALGYGRGTSVSSAWKDDKDRIINILAGPAQQGNIPRRGGKHNKTKKMRGGINIKNEEEARNLLDIPADVTKPDLKNKAKAQYRKLALLYHPDKNVDIPGASDKFEKIRSAYEFIVNNESESEEKEDQKFTYYYSIVVNNVFLTTFMNWSDDELTQFKKNMEYILLNQDFKYFSTYDLLVEFAAYNPFDYIDLLTGNLEDIKNVTLSETKDLINNYENEKMEDYKLYFKTDYEMFNNLYVEKEPIKFIQDLEDTGTPTERGRSAAEGGPGDVQNSSTPNVSNSSRPNVSNSSRPNVSNSSTPNVSNSSTPNVSNSSTPTDEDLSAKMYEDNAFGGADIKGSNKDEYSSDYANLIYGDFPNEIELNSLFNKIKDAKKNNDELNKLLGDIPPEALQNIKDNSKKIEQLVTEIKPTIESLISKFDLLIENGKKEPNMITQSGGNGMVAALVAIVMSLKTVSVGISDFLTSILSGLIPAALANFLTNIVDFIIALPETIGALITTESISELLDTYKILGFFMKIISYLPIQAYNLSYSLFSLFMPLLNAIIPYRNFIFLTLTVLYVGKKGYEWFYYNTSISSLDKKSWFRNISMNIRESLRQVSKKFSFYKSTPDGLAEMNVAEKNNWVRKVNRLKIQLYRENAFFDFEYDRFVAMSKPIVSTITVLMPQLNNQIYSKLLNTNLYTVEQIYNQQKLFIEQEYNGYPNRETMAILCFYDTYQYYAFNQFKNILKELENNKYIDYINNYIPWYLNKKTLLETKVLGNLSIDTSYPLSAFKDSTRSIVYFDLNQQKYLLNVDQQKINQYNLNERVGDNYFIYKNVNDINFSCKKFEKILNYLILMKTGYMVDVTNNVWTYTPQPHLLVNPVNNENFTGDNINPELLNSLHTISGNTTQYFLPFVYSISDEMGLNLFAYFLEKKGYKFKVLHELTRDESEEKKQTIKRSYSIINTERNPAHKTLLQNFFLKNIVHSLNDEEFERTFAPQLKGPDAEPICVLLHPFKTEGIDAKYTPAIFLLEPALNFGDYEQLCGRVLRTYEGGNRYQIKQKKMIYQCLTSSRVALNKFNDNYSHLKKDVEVIEEDYFSVKNFFDVKDVPVINPNNEFQLKNSFLSYYCPNLINYMASNLAGKSVLARGAIGSVLGGVIGVGVGLGAIPVAISAAVGAISVGVMTSNPLGKKNVGDAVGVDVLIKDALVPNTILDYAVYSSLEDSIYNSKVNVVTDGNKISTNALVILKKNINDLDRAMNDLVEGISTDKDQDIQNSLKKTNYDFYNLLNNFIVKARYALGINQDSTYYWLTNQLENAFGREDDYFEKTVRGTFAITEKFGVFMELDFKVNKYEYSKLILRDIIKYMDAFTIASDNINKQVYNVSILLELMKFLTIIPAVDDFDINTVDIGSEITEFLSIKRTEFMFNKILTKRLENKAARPDKTIPDDKIIPDLEAIIESVNAIPEQATKDKIKFMPWCDTVSKRKYNRCNTTNNYFRDINLNTYNLDDVAPVRTISDRIIAGIDGDVAADKAALDAYYLSIYRPSPYPVPNPGLARALQGANDAVVANAVVANPNAQVNAQGANAEGDAIIDDIDGGAIYKMIAKSKKRTIRKKQSTKVNVSKTRNNRKK